MKLAFVTTLAIVRSYWEARSGIADTYGCVLRSHIGTVRSMHPDAHYYIIVNELDARDETLQTVVSETNATLRVARWDETWSQLRRSGTIECCSKSWEPDFFAPQMMKLEAFQLLDYDYVLYSDLDVFLKSPLKLDDLENGSSLSSPIAGGNVEKPLHGGLVLFRPSRELVDVTQDLLYSGFSVAEGWRSRRCASSTATTTQNWSWFAASADEGLMFAAFSCLHSSYSATPYREFADRIPHEHHYGHGKPWELNGVEKRERWCKRNYARPAGPSSSLQCDRVLCV